MRRAPIFDTADAVEEAFYDAMQRGDLQGMMALWSTDDDIVCVHPNGSRLVGLDAIRSAWEAVFANGGLEVRPGDAVVHGGAVMTVHNLIERILVEGGGGVQQIVECAATNVYTKTAMGWRIVLHHASPVEEQAATAPSGTLLH